MGTSTSPTLFTLPARAKTLVPLDFSVPMEENQSDPLRRMGGTQAKVSTLFTLEGLPQKPFSAGKGGLLVGSPRLPSRDWMRAVSSPHTKAPAP